MTESLALAISGVLALVNACFVAAEFAIIGLRRTRAEALGRTAGWRGAYLESVVADLDSHVAAIRLAITSVCIAIGWIAEPALASILSRALALAGIPSVALAHSIAFVVIAATLVVAGELVPKFLSLRRTEGVALATAPLVYGFARLTRPLLRVLGAAALGLLRAAGIREHERGRDRMDPEELRIFVAELAKLERLSTSRRKMIENVLEFDQHTARQAMVPRDKIDFLSLARPLEENLAIVTETHHTRYPLCDAGLDAVVGMVHIKELLHRGSAITTSEQLRLIQRDMPFVPESQPLEALQATFLKSRSHMAMVVDEYGVPTGLITFEDVLEELVGEIRDEFDADEAPMIQRSDDGVSVDGMLLVEDLSRELGVELAANGADTMGGYVLNVLGRIPRNGDRFKLGAWDGRVVEMQGRRVARVLLRERKKKHLRDVRDREAAETSRIDSPAAEANDTTASAEKPPPPACNGTDRR